MDGNNWVIVGSTFVSSTQVRLTSDLQSLKGGIWNNAVSKLFVLLDKNLFFFSPVCIVIGK